MRDRGSGRGWVSRRWSVCRPRRSSSTGAVSSTTHLRLYPSLWSIRATSYELALSDGRVQLPPSNDSFNRSTDKYYTSHKRFSSNHRPILKVAVPSRGRGNRCRISFSSQFLFSLFLKLPIKALALRRKCLKLQFVKIMEYVYQHLMQWELILLYANTPSIAKRMSYVQSCVPN